MEDYSYDYYWLLLLFWLLVDFCSGICLCDFCLIGAFVMFWVVFLFFFKVCQSVPRSTFNLKTQNLSDLSRTLWYDVTSVGQTPSNRVLKTLVLPRLAVSIKIFPSVFMPCTKILYQTLLEGICYESPLEKQTVYYYRLLHYLFIKQRKHSNFEMTDFFKVRQMLFFSSHGTREGKKKEHSVPKGVFSLWHYFVTARDTSLIFTTNCCHTAPWNHPQTVAAFIICHAEVNLHADCTRMNAHKHTHTCYRCFWFVIVVLFFYFFFITFYIAWYSIGTGSLF